MDPTDPAIFLIAIFRPIVRLILGYVSVKYFPQKINAGGKKNGATAMTFLTIWIVHFGKGTTVAIFYCC